MESIDGTFLVGYLQASFEELKSKLGNPVYYEPGGYKTQCEWEIYVDGHVATVYDWKQSIHPEKVTRWNIGGHGSHALEVVRKRLGRTPLSC